MKLKEYIILVLGSLALGYIISWTISGSKTSEIKIKSDTPVIVKDTFLSVKDKTALFIGDSHTANNVNGWQVQLSQMVGFKMDNISVGGKMTRWMLNKSKSKITKDINYCFVFGGANDMYSDLKPEYAFENIKKIAKLCDSLGVKCYVLTGFDPEKCTRTPKPTYAPNYKKLQELILTQDMYGATPIDVRVVDRKDCWDMFCHMSSEGHKKIAEKIVLDLKLKKIVL